MRLYIGQPLPVSTNPGGPRRLSAGAASTEFWEISGGSQPRTGTTLMAGSSPLPSMLAEGIVTRERESHMPRRLSVSERRVAFAESHWWIDPAEMDDHFRRSAHEPLVEGDVSLIDVGAFDPSPWNSVVAHAQTVVGEHHRWLDIEVFDAAVSRVSTVLVDADILPADPDDRPDDVRVIVEEHLRAYDDIGLTLLSDEGAEHIADQVAAALPLPTWLARDNRR